jgi:hypothetical protein
MRLSLQKSSGTWSLSEIDEIHLELLRQAGEDASMTEFPRGRERLLPPPLSANDAAKEEEFLEDWKEYVADEMETQFSSDLATLLADIEDVESYSTDESGDETFYQLTLPTEHGERWFSALNQARILLDMKYKFHDENDEFIVEPPMEGNEEMDREERLVAYFRYDLFCNIQEWLVRNVMCLED